MVDSYCTNTSHWAELDTSNEEELRLKNYSKELACGGVCKKTILQVYYEARTYSTPAVACRGILVRELKSLSKKERKAFTSAWLMARSQYDKWVQETLLSNHYFYNNAKIIMMINELNGINGGSKSGVPKYEVHTTVSIDEDGTSHAKG